MKRHIGHIIMVSLKYFFDIDYSLCYHSFITIFVLASIIKLFFGRAQYALFEGFAYLKGSNYHQSAIEYTP